VKSSVTIKMFAFKPNPNYVPGGVNNFWVSENGSPPSGEVEQGGGGGGAVEHRMERAGGSGFGAGMSNTWSTPQKDESKKMAPKEPFFGKFGGFMENVAPLGNTYNM
jgi:hypothetical protein